MISRLTRTALATLVVAAALLFALAASAEPAFLRTTAELDEPRGYCIDIRGQAAALRINEPLQGHTCKVSQWVDMLFDDVRITADAQLYMPEYDLCLAAQAAEAGAGLVLETCAGGALQSWSHSASGNVVLTGSPELCVTLGAEAGINAGGPGYVRRSLALAPCDAAAVDRQTWAFAPPPG
jgi:hypothetical protein